MAGPRKALQRRSMGHGIEASALEIASGIEKQRCCAQLVHGPLLSKHEHFVGFISIPIDQSRP